MLFVLFGATGDLAQRKILPALCALFARGAFPEGSEIVAFSRRPWNDEEYRSFARPALKAFSENDTESFLSRVSYGQGNFDDPAAFLKLKEKLKGNEALYHLAVQPKFYEPIVQALGEAGLAGSLLIEKPFGRDQASAQELQRHIEKYFKPEQVRRVDHYFGKSGLDALVAARRTDPEFEKSLSGEQVARVTFRLLETIGIEDRGEFYDTEGALRDVVQNHLLAMLATILMRLPESIAAMPAARAQALERLALASLMQDAAVVRGQYEGYRGEPDVREDSQTETYVRIRAHSEDPAWQGVELMLEAGKGLAEKRNEIEVLYKDGARRTFPMDLPGTPDAYEKVIEAALAGESSRFASLEEVLAAWRFAESASAAFANIPLYAYKKGSGGPNESSDAAQL